MKKITVTNYKEATDIGGNTVPMCSTIELEGPEEMEASDGFHTFGELYDHRITLFIALCRHLNGVLQVENEGKYQVWRSMRHADGSMFDGWFIAGIGTKKGEQITYHLPLSRYDELSFAETLNNAPEWDGHHPNDVITRLKSL